MIWKAITLLMIGAFVAQAEIKTMTVEYTHGDAKLEGYVAYDTEFKGKRPVVMIVHQWMGLGDYEKGRAEQLAKLGYIGFAVDIYGKGNRAEDRSQARKLATTYRSDRSLMRDRANAALVFARTLPNADSDRIACIGYCFGGGVALELARSGAKLAGVVSFHGNLDTPNREDAKNIACKVLVCHGAADAGIGMDQVSEFVKEMEDGKVNWHLGIYGHAVHGFTHTHDENRYEPDAERRSWQHMLSFFGELFQ